jgi:hypothetical protein
MYIHERKTSRYNIAGSDGDGNDILHNSASSCRACQNGMSTGRQYENSQKKTYRDPIILYLPYTMAAGGA